MNVVAITGRLTAEVETRHYERDGQPGTAANFAVAVDRGPRDGADFIPVAAFGTLATTCADQIGKGHLVAISGRLHHDTWTTDQGERRSRLEVLADSVDFLARRSSKQ